MKIFFYKFLLIFVLLTLFYKFTVDSTINNLKRNFNKLYDIEIIKFEIRKEIKKLIDKEKIFSEEDVYLINKLVSKIKSELSNPK